MKDGIYSGKNDLTIEQYHDNKTHVSASALKHLRKSAKHFRAYYEKEQERKTHFDFGNAFEIALIDPDRFEDRVKLIDSDAKAAEVMRLRNEPIEAQLAELTASKEVDEKKINTLKKKLISSPTRAKEFTDWKAQQLDTDKYVIEQNGSESFATIKKMLESCYEDAVIQKLIKQCDYQCSVFWTDSETGLKLKTRPDAPIVDKNIIVDVKTALDASPTEFARAAAKHDYPIQAVMQIDGCIQSGLMSKVDTYYWLVVEKAAPYCAVLYKFTKEDREWVSDLYRHWLKILAEAKEKDIYPGYQQLSESRYGIIDLQLGIKH
jgi:hypothetical protein